MGKNQAYKAMQRAKMSSHTPGVLDELDDGMMDGSFHSPEWHAARLASLQTSHTITWEEFKQKQKEEARRQNELEDSEARMMREYRAQLDAERAGKLSRGRNHSHKKDRLKKGKKEKDKRRKKKKKSDKKRRKSESDTDDGSSSSSEEESLDSKKEKRKVRRERRQKRRRKTSESSGSETSSSEDEKEGPVPLSSFFENGKADGKAAKA